VSDAPRLFCLDTVLIDVVLKINALPTRAGDTLANDQLITTGGGFNAMSAAARHQLKVVYAGRLGEGPFSSIATSALEIEGISIPVERNDDLDTGICVVLLEPDGERSFVTSPGAEATLRSSDLDSLDVRDGDYVLVSGYNVMYDDSSDRVLAWLATLSSDVTIAFDPATRMQDIPKANLESILVHSTWLLCNAAEGALLANGADAVVGATSLASMNDRLNVVIRTGAKGCVVARNHQEANVIASFPTTVIDTNGAGDVHNGVFLAELASGHDALAAARWANAAAAMSISRFGPATCPTLDEVAARIESQGESTGDA
jgi:sugar/nucleoside kinase (ribokinase family)